MKYRYLFLLFLITIKIVLGLINIAGYRYGEVMRVKGNAIKSYQNDSKCIREIGDFIFEEDIYCAQEVGRQFTVIGTSEVRVIDAIRGKLWLRDAKIDDEERAQELENSRTHEVTKVDNFRNFFVEKFQRNVPNPESGLISGVVLGYKDDIGRDLYQKMIDSGTIHIVVASGYNVLLVGGACLSILFWVMNRKKATVAAIILMLGYAVLAGGDPPVMRAVWMAGIMYFAVLLGRKGDSLWVLSLAVVVMLLIDLSLLASASFQLSVAASFGLLSVDPWLGKYIEKQFGVWLGNFFGGIGLTTTLSTMMMTAPIIWWHFGRMSLIGIVSNILILPLVPPMMILGVGAMILPGVFSWPVYALGHLAVELIKFFGR